MTDTCGDHIITPGDIAASASSIKAIVATAKTEGLLPASSTLTLDKGSLGTAHVNISGNIWADPVYFSCLSPTIQKAVLMHETGHYQDWLMPVFIADTYLQAILVVSAAKIIATRLYKAAHAKAVKQLLPSRKQNIVLAFLAAAYALNGTLNALLGEELEYRADRYSAFIMQSGKPISDFFAATGKIKIDHWHDPDGTPRQSKAGYYAFVGHQHLLFGLAGFFLKTHPSDAKRIDNVATHSIKAPPFGMHVPEFYQQRVTVNLGGLNPN